MSEEKIESKVVELLDKAGNGVEQLTLKLAEIGEKYGPEVVDAGLVIAQLTAGQSLIFGLVAVVISMVIFYFAKGRFEKSVALAKKADSSYTTPDDFFSFWFGVILTIVGVASVGAGLPKLINIWNWVGIIEPKLWIAHRILNW